MIGLLSALLSPPLGARALDDPVATVNVFRGALQDGNVAQALSLLAPEVLIYESGGEEKSRDEYAATHLKADIKHLAAYYVDTLTQTSREHEGLACVTTRSRYLSKSADPRPAQFGTETIVLRRLATGWQIVHVHWSSSGEDTDR